MRSNRRPWGAAGRRHGRWRAGAESGWWNRRRPRAPPWRCAPRRRSGCRASSMPRGSSAQQRRGPSGAPYRARWDGRRAPARRAAATCPALRRPPAKWPRCPETGSRRRAMAQARQQISAACFEGDLAVGEARADGLHARRRPRPPRRSSVTPPGTRTQGRSRMEASAIIMAGSPLSQVATPITPRRVGSERIRRRENGGGVVAIRQAVEHAGGALRAAVAGVGAISREGDCASALSSRAAASISRPTSQWPV